MISKGEINAVLNDDNNYLIGGNIYHLPWKGEIKITRLIKKKCRPIKIGSIQSIKERIKLIKLFHDRNITN